jgi:hypothetical protein
MDGCQVFIKEEMDDHNDTKDWGSSSATALIKEETDDHSDTKDWGSSSATAFIKEEMDDLEDVKCGDSASSSGTLSFDEVIQFKVNWDFYIFIFNHQVISQIDIVSS